MDQVGHIFSRKHDSQPTSCGGRIRGGISRSVDIGLVGVVGARVVGKLTSPRDGGHFRRTPCVGRRLGHRRCSRAVSPHTCDVVVDIEHLLF